MNTPNTSPTDVSKWLPPIQILQPLNGTLNMPNQANPPLSQNTLGRTTPQSSDTLFSYPIVNDPIIPPNHTSTAHASGHNPPPT